MTVPVAEQTAEIAEIAANTLWLAQQNLRTCAPVRELLSGAGPDFAYRVQDINTNRRLAEGARLVGRKIGLTSMAVQRQLGVDQPDYGMLFADMARADGETVSMTRLIQPKVEGEIAFMLGRDLDFATPTIADLLRAVDFAVVAIEIVDSRVQNWDIRLVDTIADNASAAMYVLGTQPRLLRDIDLVHCGMLMERGGEQVSIGSGEACMGNPLVAALWLAATMARVGRPLKAGDTILSGALGPMVPAKAGDAFEVRVSGLGSVRVSFA
jgi:2-keto-4-pentenoate hydratase